MATFEIYQSGYTASQMESLFSSGLIRINSTTKHWEIYNISTATWTDTGINAEAQTTGATWGAITGTLSNQSDLNTALSGKVDLDSSSTESFTLGYDSNGLYIVTD